MSEDTVPYYHKPEPISDPVVHGVCRLLLSRSAVGIKKYGTTTADNPLELRAWLQHALEECLDQAVYLRRAIIEIESGND